MQTHSFLSYVAEDLLSRFGDDLAHVAVVFPNKRASLFLNQELARQAQHALWSPTYLTISDLFRSQSTLQVADPIKSVCDLYRVYSRVTGSTESLDHFYGWGQMLLADFDDIDKNMANAEQVFSNISGLHEMDDLSYLNDTQRELLNRFFANFHADDQNSILRQRFLKMWSRLYDVYAAYKQHLDAQGLAYEGMLYREVADRPTLSLPHKHYVFVGFNVLQQVEQVLFTRLKREGKASFYWNFDKYYMSDDAFPNESGVYIKQWLEKFPNQLDNKRADIYDNLSKAKDITFLSSPTDDIQARYVTTWLRENERYKDGARTAIVLADESLLGTVVHCIPSEADGVNITTGYPLSQTPIATLVSQLVNVQLHGYRNDRGTYRLHEINGVLRHPYAKLLHPQATQIRTELNKNHSFFPKASEVPFLILPEGDSYLEQLSQWLTSSVEAVGKSSAVHAHNPLFEESVFRMYTLLTRLHDLIRSGDLDVDAITFQRLLSQLIKTTTIPYHGEPAEGVQIMGVLETRNLDFDHVLILSCNEGNLPKGVDDASFIPHALRKAFGLTTIDNKVAIFSYYFHSLLQRAKDITIAYSTSPEGKGRGSMSRFMLQMLTELPYPIRQVSLMASQTTIPTFKKAQAKSDIVMRKLSEIETLSPSALITYLKCQKMFFYKYVVGLRENDDEDEDTIDNRLFGNIFHRAAQLIYEQLLPHDLITSDDIGRLLKQKHSLDSVLDQAFNEELFRLPEGTTRKPTLNGTQLINREVIEKYLYRLLKIDQQLTPFQVISHETEIEGQPFTIGSQSVRIKGRIDRLDRINIDGANECLRVVDYKTGRKNVGDIKKISDIFDADNIEKSHTDYILQAMAYSLIVATHAPDLNPRNLPVSPALLFIQHAGDSQYNPTLTIGKQPIASVADYEEEFLDGMQTLLTNIFGDDGKPFDTNGSEAVCKNCPYLAVCGEHR